jgi:hypothetical protein
MKTNTKHKFLKPGTKHSTLKLKLDIEFGTGIKHCEGRALLPLNWTPLSMYEKIKYQARIEHLTLKLKLNIEDALRLKIALTIALPWVKGS